jgi:hypothetical protein
MITCRNRPPCSRFARTTRNCTPNCLLQPHKRSALVGDARIPRGAQTVSTFGHCHLQSPGLSPFLVYHAPPRYLESCKKMKSRSFIKKKKTYERNNMKKHFLNCNKENSFTVPQIRRIMQFSRVYRDSFLFAFLVPTTVRNFTKPPTIQRHTPRGNIFA